MGKISENDKKLEYFKLKFQDANSQRWMHLSIRNAAGIALLALLGSLLGSGALDNFSVQLSLLSSIVLFILVIILAFMVGKHHIRTVEKEKERYADRDIIFELLEMSEKDKSEYEKLFSEKLSKK